MLLCKQTNYRVAFFLVIFFSLPLKVLGVEVLYLYKAEIPVSDQSAETRREAFIKALETVLIRLSGYRGIAAMSESQNILQNASRYVLQYRYQSIEPAKNNQAVVLPLLLQVEFDGLALTAQMQRENLPVWGSNRPNSLMWVGVEQGFNRHMQAEDDRDPIRAAFDVAAVQRGLPLLFPLMDLDDQEQVGFADITGGFATRILDASSRYDADTVVTVALIQQNNKMLWKSHWTVYKENVASRWSTDGNLQEIISAGIDGIADILASRYASRGGEQKRTHEIKLQVSNISGLQGYARVLNHLKSLQPVISVQPVWIYDDTVHYKLLLQGDQQNLERVVLLGRVLFPVSGPEDIPAPLLQTDNVVPLLDDSVNLSYRYRD